MERAIENLKVNSYDLLVVGGGINGAAIANIASARGMRVALVEKGDFSSGTSSRSSKLIHGGIRYLENYQFPLVYESLRERHCLLREAPHLVWPLRFLIPVYQGDRRPLWMMRAGVLLYDLIAGRHRVEAHKSLGVADVLRLEPALAKEGLKGGVIYYDAQMDDARLCLENVLSAAHRGADAANYVEVVSFLKENGKAVGVQARDLLSEDKNSFQIRARKIVCAVGPWTNRVLKLDDRHARNRVRTTKGVHIIYPQSLTQGALLIPAQRDNRIFFVMPWMGNTLIGTTDTDYGGDPDDVRCEGEDIDYLIRETRRIFPALNIQAKDFEMNFAGLRPLISREGDPSKVSREHAIFETYSGVIFVTGGKYTTYRVVARECVDRLRKGKADGEDAVYGAGVVKEKPAAVAGFYGVKADVIRRLIAQYGSKYKEVLGLVRCNPELGGKICPELPWIKAQLVYAEKVEMARTVEDIIFRRLSIGFVAHKMKKCEQVLRQTIPELCFQE